MSLRKILLLIGLLIAIWLAFFADKPASTGVSEAVSVPSFKANEDRKAQTPLR